MIVVIASASCTLPSTDGSASLLRMSARALGKLAVMVLVDYKMRLLPVAIGGRCEWGAR